LGTYFEKEIEWKGINKIGNLMSAK